MRKPIYFIAIIASCIVGTSCNSKEQKSNESQETLAKKEDTKEENKKEHPGASVYAQNCGTCHQPDGSGVPGLYPPIQDSEWINGDKTRLINVVLNGLSGPIEVNGETYNNVMPQFSYLSDQQIADLLTYLRQAFENNAEAISPEEVAKVRGEGEG